MPQKFTQHQSLYSPLGERKYLNAEERQRFLQRAEEIGQIDPTIHTLCKTLVYTGCRISEALALTTSSIYLAEGVIAVHTLKRRNVYHIRHVPVPTELIFLLDKVHHLQEAKAFNESKRLWPYHRVTAYHHIKEIMAQADIKGIHACPRGLRHGFGVHAISCGIPLHLIQR